MPARWYFFPANRLLVVTWVVLLAGPIVWSNQTVAVAGAVALASGIGSMVGFAFSGICGSILFHIVPEPVKIVQIMMTCSIVNQAAMTWLIREEIDWGNLGLFLLGGIVGIPLGLWVLLGADRSTYLHAFGSFLIVYGAFMIARPHARCAQHPVFDVFVGFVGGVTGAALAFPSAPVTIWCSMKGWGKDRQRAVYQPFILIIQIASLIAMTLIGQRQGAATPYDWSNLLLLPGSLIGTALGMRLYHRFSETQFRRVVNFMLIVVGAMYFA